MSLAQLVPRLLCSAGDVLCHGSRSELFISRKFKLCIDSSDVWGRRRCGSCFGNGGGKFTIPRLGFAAWVSLMSGDAKLVIFTEQIVSHSKGVTFKVHGNLIREQRRQILRCIQAVEAPG